MARRKIINRESDTHSGFEEPIGETISFVFEGMDVVVEFYT